MMVHATTLALLVQGRGTSFAGSGTALYDSFTTYNGSVWSYADGAMGTTDGCRVWCVFGAADHFVGQLAAADHSHYKVGAGVKPLPQEPLAVD